MTGEEQFAAVDVDTALAIAKEAGWARVRAEEAAIGTPFVVYEAVFSYACVVVAFVASWLAPVVDDLSFYSIYILAAAALVLIYMLVSGHRQSARATANVSGKSKRRD